MIHQSTYSFFYQVNDFYLYVIHIFISYIDAFMKILKSFRFVMHI